MLANRIESGGVYDDSIEQVFLLLAGLCLCAANPSAQSTSIDLRTALSSACVVPSDETDSLEFIADSSYLQLNDTDGYASVQHS